MNRLFRQWRRRGGFTIAEVMCAAFIVMVSVSGITMSFIVAVRTNRFASYYYNAASLARNRIQKARTVPYKDLWALAELQTKVTKDGDAIMVGSEEYNRAIYQRETFVTNTLRDCFEVTVNVYYPITRKLYTDTPVTMKTVISGQLADFD